MRISYACCTVLRAVAQPSTVLLVILPKGKSALALYLLYLPKEDGWWTEYDELGLSHARTTGRETLL